MQKTTNKAPWVKCTYRAFDGIVNGYGVGVDLGDGNIPWPVGCHKVRGKWYLSDMLTAFWLCGYKRMPTVGEIIQAMPIFIRHAEDKFHSEELDEMRIILSPEIRAYKTLAVFNPHVSNVTLRKLCWVRYLDRDFSGMCLRMGWHAKEG